GQIEARPFRQVLRVHVSAVTIRWNGGECSGCARRETVFAAERRERDADTRSELGPAVRAALEIPDLESRVREFVRQESEPGNESRPPPLRRLQIQQLHFKGIA